MIYLLDTNACIVYLNGRNINLRCRIEDQLDSDISRLALKIVVMARQKARGKSEEGLGDFTFLYTVWFYCVHLLSRLFYC